MGWSISCFFRLVGFDWKKSAGGKEARDVCPQDPINRCKWLAVFESWGGQFAQVWNHCLWQQGKQEASDIWVCPIGHGFLRWQGGSFLRLPRKTSRPGGKGGASTKAQVPSARLGVRRRIRRVEFGGRRRVKSLSWGEGEGKGRVLCCSIFQPLVSVTAPRCFGEGTVRSSRGAEPLECAARYK